MQFTHDQPLRIIHKSMDTYIVTVCLPEVSNMTEFITFLGGLASRGGLGCRRQWGGDRGRLGLGMLGLASGGRLRWGGNGGGCIYKESKSGTNIACASLVVKESIGAVEDCYKVRVGTVGRARFP
jgi:hypothetical protein